MSKIKTILIEDEPLARKWLEQLCDSIRILDVLGTFECPSDTIELIKSGKVDLIISDIQMPEMDGISFLKSLKHPPFVIFITAYPEFATEGFELDVLDYILKPLLSEERLLKAIEKAQKAIAYNKSDMGRNEYLKFKDRDKTLFLTPSEIQFIEAWGDYVKVYTTEGYLTQLYTMKQMEEMLPWNSFVRMHRSYIINVEHVKSINATKVILKNGKELGIGMKYRTQLYSRMGLK